MMNPNQEGLFRELDKARYGEHRPLRYLFLSGKLKSAADDVRLQDEDQDRAYSIVRRWAELEVSGKLQKKKETALQGEFLAEVFGQALGYTLFSENLKEWNLEPQFTVNGGTADAAIGLFTHGKKRPPTAVIELKGPTVNVDRDRFNGRTPVQQLWDYLSALPECRWGIVCNYVSFRLYHRSHGSRVYQLFTLDDFLRDRNSFNQFYYIFQRGGLLPTDGQRPRAEKLLEQCEERQREVGNDLYGLYAGRREELIRDFMRGPQGMDREKAIQVAQRLIDRIVFIAFCEDRRLLPEDAIHAACRKVPGYPRVDNPKWDNFLTLFRWIDAGNSERNVPAYDGGLFQKGEVDELDLDDAWTDFFSAISDFDFSQEVNVEVLGHLFERSLNALDRIRRFGLLGEKAGTEEAPKMDKVAERKRSGIYYTPPEFTKYIVTRTVGEVVEERLAPLAEHHGLDPSEVGVKEPDLRRAKYWRECFETLRQIKIVDPACGSGAFLFQAYELLEGKYGEIVYQLEYHEKTKIHPLREQIPDIILRDNLYGVDLSHEAVELTQLALWIRSARRGKKLTDLSKNIVRGNSLATDGGVHPHAMEWSTTFPEVFSRENPGFDCVIGNPPWERMKLQEREFFDALAPQIASAVSAAERRRLIGELEKKNPDLYASYREASNAADRALDHIRTCGRFPLTGKGDINTYAVFAELARTIVASNGRVGLLVPSGIATDHTTKEYFGELVDSKSLVALYDFENREKIFPDVDGRYKFCVLLFGGAEKKADSIDFVFFARRMDELADKKRHIVLSAQDFKLLNPNTRTCPIFRSRRDAELTRAIYRRVPVLVDKTRKKGGNPWGIRFLRMFDQTNDAELFHTAEQLQAESFKRDGSRWKKGKKVFLPLYEAKMIQMYDHRAASVVIEDKNWMRQGQTAETALVQHQNLEFCVEPRWWVEERSVQEILSGENVPAFIAYKDVTSPTNQRTMISAFIPFVGVLNSAPLMLPGADIAARQQCCLLANLNGFAFDFIARQKVGGLHLNFFIVEQLPIFSPDFYASRCPWNQRQTLEKWISDRVLKLTCTSNDMIPLAEAAGFDPPVHKWKPEERADLMAELDAAYFILYGIERDDVEYILSTFVIAQEAGPDLLGGMTTRDLILTHYDHLREKSHTKLPSIK